MKFINKEEALSWIELILKEKKHADEILKEKIAKKEEKSK